MRLRAPRPADLKSVHAVVAARDTADLGAPDYTLEDLRDEWRSSSGFDLGLDAQVAEDDTGRIVAYGVVRPSGSIAVVAPDAEGKGVGTALLEWVERRERELGHARHRQWVAATQDTARVLLVAAGYELARSNWRMVVELPAPGARPPDPGARPPDPGARPPGPGARPPAPVRLRPLDPDADAAAIHALDAHSFAQDPGYVPESFAAFTHEHLKAHDLDPALSVVAERDRRIVGFLLARRGVDETVGYVDLLAVEPSEQGRGIGRALLSHAFTGFAAAGLRKAQLGVSSDNPRARRLYERAGMTPRLRFDVYERPSSR